MRVLFTVSPWATHYLSTVPLGWALQAAGHEVRVLCPPSEEATVSRAGLTPVPVLDGLEVVVRNRLQAVEHARTASWPYPWPPLHPLTGEELPSLADFDLDRFRAEHRLDWAARAARSFDAAVGFARSWRPQLVLHDPVSLEGPLAARVLGVPPVMSLWGPVGTNEPTPLRIVPEDVGDAFGRYGLDGLGPEVVDHVVDPCPESLAPPTDAKRLPVRHLPYNGPGRPPEGLLDPPRRPRVCVAWSTGLTAMAGPRSYLLPRLVRALSELDVELVVTATEQDVAALGPVPSSVRVLTRCPLRLLLPGCAAVVHHGGAGSTMTALWAGVPQLALTFAAEQSANGERVAATGAGLHLYGHLATGPAVAAAVGALLETDSHQRHALRLKDELERRPTPADLVEPLCELARS